MMLNMNAARTLLRFGLKHEAAEEQNTPHPHLSLSMVEKR